jgi:general L-amino acid transport system permease protein
MQENQFAYVRNEMERPQAAPAGQKGFVHWARTNLFATPTDTILTLFFLALLAWFVPAMVNWLFINAQWTGDNRTFCATIAQGGVQPDGWSGACWAFVTNKFGQFMFNTYPIDERWRPMLLAVLLVGLLVPFLMPKAPYKTANAIGLFVVLPILGFILLPGGWFGLRYVPTREWGGFMVTIILSYVGIVVSLPMGVVLALGRRSTLPVIKILCVIFIEIVRGVPLITVLFMATKMLPLFMPDNAKIDDFVCVLIGVAVFASAYMAEVIRGGLQAMPKGQYEGAMSLGLGYWSMMRLIILPQALRIVIPGIVNTFIGLFKDTTLVTIVGIFDFLRTIEATLVDPTWATPTTRATGYAFAAIFYFLCCWGMSRYSIAVEKRLAAGQKR